MPWRRKERASRGVRLFFATDIHGSDRCFRKWLNAAEAYEAAVLILGGDVTGKTLVPVVSSNGGWIAELDGEERIAESASERDALVRDIRGNGRYDALVSPDELEELQSSEIAFEAKFRAAMRHSLQRWSELAHERLADRDVPAFVMLGNDDEPELADIFRATDVFTYAEDGIFRLPSGNELLSFGYSAPTPWHTPRELPEDQLGARLTALADKLEDPASAVFNVHCPPENTGLDQAPELDEDLRPVVEMGSQRFISAGSAAVHETIERYQPLLGLHGHIHESAAAEQIGRTLCINPGSEYFLGSLRGAIADLDPDGGRLLRWQITQG